MAKALVVDDSRPVRMILTRFLNQLGYEVQEAGNGRQALEILNEQATAFQLVLVDWNMPEMNGFELLVSLRADQRFATVSIVMITTETEMDRVAAALEAGANEYVMKPFTADILRDKLQLLGIPA